MTVVEYLRSLIAGYKVKEAIQKLSSLFTVSDPDLETTTIILSSEFNLLTTQKMEGLISNEEFTIRSNRLNKKVLDLIKEVEKNFELYAGYFDQQTKDIILSKEDSSKKIVLFLCANPDEADIDLSREIKEISEQLSLINQRGKFEFRVKKDLRKKDFQRAILGLDAHPRFLHFSGSGNYKVKNKKDGLKLLGNDFNSVAVLEPKIMIKVLQKFKSLECVFLNACNTTPLALELSKSIPYMITMDHYIRDELAITFASSFYEAIGAGKDIEFSFGYALDNLELEGKYKDFELKTPRLIKKGEQVDYKWHGQTFEEWKEAAYQ